MLNQMNSNLISKMYSESCCFMTVPLWPVIGNPLTKVKLGQDTSLLKLFKAAQRKCHGLTMSQYALCNLISDTHLLTTPLYSFLNIAGKPQAQSLATPVSYFLCMECSVLIFSLSCHHLHISAHMTFSLWLQSSFCIAVQNLKPPPPSTNTQTLVISQALHLIFSRELMTI